MQHDSTQVIIIYYLSVISIIIDYCWNFILSKNLKQRIDELLHSDLSWGELIVAKQRFKLKFLS